METQGKAGLMFAILNVLPGISPEDIITGVTAVLTGETQAANLPAGFDAENSEIINALPSQVWTLYDAAVGLGQRVLKTVHPKNSSLPAYALLQVDSGFFYLYGYAQWNAILHQGTTQLGSNNSNEHQKLNLSYGGQIIIAANQRFIALGTLDALYNLWGSRGSMGYIGGLNLVTLYDPAGTHGYEVNTPDIAAFNTASVFNGSIHSGSHRFIVPALVHDAYGNWLSPQSRNDDFWLISGMTYNGGMRTKKELYPHGTSAKMPDVGGQFIVPFMQYHIGQPAKYGYPAEWSLFCDIWGVPYEGVAHLSVVEKAGELYVALGCYGDIQQNHHVMMFRRG